LLLIAREPTLKDRFSSGADASGMPPMGVSGSS